jgi:hypothetical protein
MRPRSHPSEQLMRALTRTHTRPHPSHLQEKVGATAVAVVKTNNTTLTAGRGKKFKFGVWCMCSGMHALNASALSGHLLMHQLPHACRAWYAFCGTASCWHALASAGQLRATCTCGLCGLALALLCMANMRFAAAQRATDTHHAWRREQQRRALHVSAIVCIDRRGTDHPLVGSIVWICAVAWFHHFHAIATSASTRTMEWPSHGRSSLAE